MGAIIHKNIVKVEVTCEDGTVLVFNGEGSVHVNDNETKTDKPGKVIKSRSMMIGMAVTTEEIK